MRSHALLLAFAGVVSIMCACGVSAPNEDLGTNTAALNANDKIAFDYFLGKGLTPTQTAGIIGNLDVESSMDPTAVQSGGPGRGIAQWSAGARWDTTSGDNVKSYATSHNADPLSLALQLDFIWFELSSFSSYGLTQLKAATTVSAAEKAFQTYYEGCGACDTTARVADAQMALNAYGSDVPADGGANDQDAGISCVVTTTGIAGECISTSACMALGNHVSTPGYCPGAANVQCCTPTEDAADGGGSGTGTGTGTGGGGGYGGATRPGNSESGGGCSTASGNGDAASGGLLLVAVALVSRKRRARA